MAALIAPVRRLGEAVRGLAGRQRPPFARGRSLPGSWFVAVSRMRRRPPRPDEEGWGGVREPRRPRRTPPSGAMALREPGAGAEPTDLSR